MADSIEANEQNTPESTIEHQPIRQREVTQETPTQKTDVKAEFMKMPPQAREYIKDLVQVLHISPEEAIDTIKPLVDSALSHKKKGSEIEDYIEALNDPSSNSDRIFKGFQSHVLGRLLKRNEAAGMDEKTKNIIEDFMTKDPPRSRQEALDMISSLVDQTDLRSKFYNFEGDPTLKQYYPDGLREVLETIMDFAEERFQEGGEYELIDAGGKLHPEHLTHWVRFKIWYASDQSPDDEKFNAFGEVSVPRALGQLGLIDLVFNNRYWRETKQTRTPVMVLNGKTGEYEQKEIIEYKQVYNPEYLKLKDELFMEAWQAGLDHTGNAGLNNRRGSEKEVADFLTQFYKMQYYLKNESRLLESTYGAKSIYDWDSHSRHLKGTENERTGHSLGDARRFDDALNLAVAQLEDIDGKTGEFVRDNIFIEKLQMHNVEDVFFKTLFSHQFSNYLSKALSDKDISLLFNIPDGEQSTMNIKERKELLNALVGYKDILLGTDNNNNVRMEGYGFYDILFTASQEQRYQKLSFYREKISMQYRNVFNEKTGLNLSMHDVTRYFSLLKENNNVPPKDMSPALIMFGQSVENHLQELAKIDFVTNHKTREFTGKKDESFSAMQIILKRQGWSDYEVSKFSSPKENYRDIGLLMVSRFEDEGEMRALPNKVISDFKKENKRSPSDEEYENAFDKAYKQKAVQLLNFTRGSQYPPSIEGLRKDAFKTSAAVAYKVDIEEALFADHRSSQFSRISGMIGANDTTWTGHNADTKLTGTAGYEWGNLGKNFSGNRYSIPGIRRVALPFVYAMWGDYEGEKMTLADVIFAKEINGKRVEPTKFKVKFGLEYTYATSHIPKAFNVYELLESGEFFNSLRSEIKTVNGKTFLTAKGEDYFRKKVLNPLRYTFESMYDDGTKGEKSLFEQLKMPRAGLDFELGYSKETGSRPKPLFGNKSGKKTLADYWFGPELYDFADKKIRISERAIHYLGAMGLRNAMDWKSNGSPKLEEHEIHQFQTAWGRLARDEEYASPNWVQKTFGFNAEQRKRRSGFASQKHVEEMLRLAGQSRRKRQFMSFWMIFFSSLFSTIKETSTTLSKTKW